MRPMRNIFQSTSINPMRPMRNIFQSTSITYSMDT